jgi:type IX secretion system PorP/SprF family membrane protein
VRRLFFILAILWLSVVTYGQYSQYMVNGLVINPAYAGSRDGMSVSFHYSKIWAGISGMPEQELISAHAPLKNDKFAFGMILGNQTTGPDHSIYASLDYAYRIHLKKKILAFGLRAKIKHTNQNFNQLYFDPAMPQDPVFVNNVVTEPNAGFGVYLYSQRMFAGISVPRMITYKYDDTITYHYGPTLHPGYAHIMATGGVVIGKENGLIWRPSMLVQYLGTVKSYRLDVNNMFIFLKNKLWMGASYRMGGNSIESQIVGIVEFKFNDQFMVGYSYDYGLGDLSSVLHGSHEVYLRYDFVYKVRAANPRYF